MPERRPTIIVTDWHRQFVRDKDITAEEAAQMLRWAFEMVHVAATLIAACEDGRARAAEDLWL